MRVFAIGRAMERWCNCRVTSEVDVREEVLRAAKVMVALRTTALDGAIVMFCNVMCMMRYGVDVEVVRLWVFGRRQGGLVWFGHRCTREVNWSAKDSSRDPAFLLPPSRVTRHNSRVFLLFFRLFRLDFCIKSESVFSTMDRYLVHSTAPTGNTAEHVAHAQPAQLAGSKRKSTDAPPTIDLDDFDVPEGQVMDSCTVVRGKIKRFLDSGEMRIGQFCDAIGVSQNAYRRFMAEKGQYGGMGCDTYQSAWEFFRKRELAGLKIPTKKQKTAAAAKAGASAAPAKSSTMVGKKDAVTDISSVHLEGNYDAESGVFCAWLTMV